jgi:hypothetical protein
MIGNTPGHLYIVAIQYLSHTDEHGPFDSWAEAKAFKDRLPPGTHATVKPLLGAG